MNAKDKVSVLRLFNIILYITSDNVDAAAANRNILVMSTVVWAPAIVTTVEKVSLCSSTRYIIQPDRSASRAISVSQCLSSIPVGKKNKLTASQTMLITMYKKA